MTFSDWVWLAIGAAGLGFEGFALVSKTSGDTLSEKIWRIFGTARRKPGDPEPTRDRSGWTQARRFILLAFMVWLTVHFLSGGWV